MPRHQRPAAVTFTFDPDHVAKLETEGWRAYYDKKWLRVLYLTERTTATEFHVPFPLSAQGAYFVTRAAIAFKPVDNDLPATRAGLGSYYALVRKWSGLTFDVPAVTDLELEYWIVHRRLSGAADHTELENVLTRLHAATFGIPLERARESGKRRSDAAITVDGITGHRSVDIEADWRRLEEQLRDCYRSLEREIRS
jgi:hypothetical protein